MVKKKLPAAAVRPATSRSLALAFMGELRRSGNTDPVRAVDVVAVLQAAGVSAASARAALDRFVLRGLLTRDQGDRGVAYCLTDAGQKVLADGASRVHASTPFEPRGEGWTVVTFSVPEGNRGLRHRLRSALTWAGFAALRDGVWIAAGERDPERVFSALASDLAAAEIVAFHAHDLASFPMADRVQSAWDIPDIRGAHERFIERWGSDGPGGADYSDGGITPLAATVLLTADWIALLRKDPSLHISCLGDEWPARRSHETYLSAKSRLAEGTSKAAAELGLVYT